MGGMDGFGKVEPEPNEPTFHEPWEGRVMAMNRAMGATGVWNIDMGRHTREKLPPHIYLQATYYQKWFLGLQQMLLERGLICRADDRGDPVVQISPPLVAGRREFETIAGTLGAVLQEAGERMQVTA